MEPEGVDPRASAACPFCGAVTAIDLRSHSLTECCEHLVCVSYQLSESRNRFVSRLSYKGPWMFSVARLLKQGREIQSNNTDVPFAILHDEKISSVLFLFAAQRMKFILDVCSHDKS